MFQKGNVPKRKARVLEPKLTPDQIVKARADLAHVIEDKDSLEIADPRQQQQQGRSHTQRLINR